MSASILAGCTRSSDSVESLRLFRVEPFAHVWERITQFPGETTREWVDFIAAAQNAKPVIAELRDGGNGLGFFIGLVTTKFGVRILGSPFQGWMTPCMGFRMSPTVRPALALQALEKFAFEELGCAHVEILDRSLTVEDARLSGYSYNISGSYETDLSESVDQLFSRMTGACRRCIRKSERTGIYIEECKGDGDFVSEYYSQLRDGLLVKGLVPSYDAGVVSRLIDQLLPSGRLLLLRARDTDGRCIATGIYPATDATAHVWGNVTSYTWARPLRPTEALNWYAMRYWKTRGIGRFDWGGLGRHKEKYGGRAVQVLRLRKSRSDLVARLREMAETFLRHRLWVEGTLRTAWSKTLTSRRCGLQPRSHVTGRPRSMTNASGLTTS